MAEQKQIHFTGKPLTGWELFHLPEFQALMIKLEIPILPVKWITIRTNREDEMATIELEYQLLLSEPANTVDTTNLTNEAYRTKVPNPRIS